MQHVNVWRWAGGEGIEWGVTTSLSSNKESLNSLTVDFQHSPGQSLAGFYVHSKLVSLIKVAKHPQILSLVNHACMCVSNHLLTPQILQCEQHI